MDKHILAEQLTDGDLKSINRLTLRPLTESDVFTFGLDVMESETPTSNGRIWSKEWLGKNAPRFVGTPVTLGHTEPNALESKVATIYASDYNPSSGWLKARAFVPLTDPQGPVAKEKLENGTYQNVSIEGIGAIEKHGDHVRIVPSEDDRALAVAIVLKPGLATAKVTESIPEGLSPMARDPATQHDDLLTFAKEAITELNNDFVRVAGFALEADRPLLKKVAEQLDPFTLRAFIKAIDKSYVSRQTVSATEARVATETVNTAVDDVLKRLRRNKGME